MSEYEELSRLNNHIAVLKSENKRFEADLVEWRERYAALEKKLAERDAVIKEINELCYPERNPYKRMRDHEEIEMCLAWSDVCDKIRAAIEGMGKP
jgi:hypothetical protein